MSIIEDLGARIRAAADDLPVDQVTRALEHLSAVADRLRWVRQESVNPLGVPEVAAAIAHAEAAGHALRVAQEQLAAYLAAIGLSGSTPAHVRGASAGSAACAPSQPTGRSTKDHRATAVPAWWAARVTELTRRDDQVQDSSPPAHDAEELLRRVAQGVRTGDRGRLHTELRKVTPDVGIGLSAAATPVLQRLATRLLGHPPRVPDLPRLRRELAGDVHDLLPGLPPAVLDVLLSRLCRTPPPRMTRPHPADQALAAGVLAGVLLRRVGDSSDRSWDNDA